jgi:hypothetical protein
MEKDLEKEDKRKLLERMVPMFRNKPENIEEKIDRYTEELAPVPKRLVELALKEIIKEESFFPAFAEIYQECLKMSLPFDNFAVPDVYNAWKECEAWIGGNEKCAKTPLVEMTMRLIGKPVLKKTTTENIGYIKKDFEKAYNLAVRESRKYVLNHVCGKDEENNPHWNIYSMKDKKGDSDEKGKKSAESVVSPEEQERLCAKTQATLEKIQLGWKKKLSSS